MGLVIAPIVDGKLEAWKKFINDMKSGSKKEDFNELNQRYGLSRHDVWYAETPEGPMAVVLHEGPGADEFMQVLAQSDNSFDAWMREQITEFHNMNFNEPPPGPPPQKLI
jgi:hypothetical protein